MNSESGFRVDRDTLGEVRIPAEAYWGPQAQRATENFPISGHRAYPAFVRALARIKRAAAWANSQAGVLDERLAKAIMQAADEVLEDKLPGAFPVDVYNSGAGTSMHMNMNEVLANRANEFLGGEKGSYDPVHPNDHVNFGQSSNDIIPTATRLSAVSVAPDLVEALRELAAALARKGEELDDVITAARTHLQDAVPVRLGQEFAAYGRAVERRAAGIDQAADGLRELNIGATAAGTGLNTHPRYRELVVEELSRLIGQPLRPAENMVEITQSHAAMLEFSAALRGYAVELLRITNDLRLLSSGPNTGLAEIQLPAVQPGSSIMPAKVNPVVPEMVNMVCFRVVGADATVMMAVQAGQINLNVFAPVIANELLHAVTILTSASHVLARKCVAGILADEERCRHYAETSLALATALSPYIGYAAAAEVAKESQRTGRKITEIVRERGLLPEDQAEELLDLRRMTEPGQPEGP